MMYLWLLSMCLDRATLNYAIRRPPTRSAPTRPDPTRPDPTGPDPTDRPTDRPGARAGPRPRPGRGGGAAARPVAYTKLTRPTKTEVETTGGSLITNN